MTFRANEIVPRGDVTAPTEPFKYNQKNKMIKWCVKIESVVIRGLKQF